MAEIPDEIRAQIVKGKGKRTKRLRFDPPSTSSDNCSSCSSAGVLTEEEEEDQDLAAKCLILLAQGKTEQFVLANADDKSLFLNYQCKTCDRCFNSFQALGGHRASHKKPRINGDFSDSVHLSLQLATTSRHLPPLMTTVVKSKVHECSVCRAEFSSGQALGGHMRRHRAATATATSKDMPPPPQLQQLMIKKERNVLGLDLNLPAPEEDRHRPVVAVFSAASPLVDCHY